MTVQPRATAAIEAYHDLLDNGLAEDSAAHLDAQTRRRGLLVGGRPLCTVLRPRFLTAAQYQTCQRRGAVILRAFAKAHRVAVKDPAVRAQFRLTDWEEELVLDDPGFPWPSPTARLDAFFDQDGRGLRFTEYNAETPAGAGFTDELTELFEGMPAMLAFQRRYQARALRARTGVAGTLLAAHARWCGRREVPRIGILDWKDVSTRAEFDLFARWFGEQGIPCVIADPREVEYRAGRLVAGDFPITLIYKRVLIHELIERGGLDQPVVRAVRDGAVCMVNSFGCKLLHKKASLAVLSDERNARLYTASERTAIHEHIPWTRVVEERMTESREGRSVDLLPFIAEHRTELVLKPNDDYGGKGIVLGWEVDDATWTEALRRATQEPFIVQQRLALPKEPYPAMVDDRLVVADRMLDTAPFVSYGRFVEGCLTRLSTSSLLNVAATGGSSVPTYVIEGRRP